MDSPERTRLKGSPWRRPRSKKSDRPRPARGHRVLGGDNAGGHAARGAVAGERALAATTAGPPNCSISTRTVPHGRRRIPPGNQRDHRVDVRESKAEVETTTGTVVQVFTTGTVVQVYLLANGVRRTRGARTGRESVLNPGGRSCWS